MANSTASVTRGRSSRSGATKEGAGSEWAGLAKAVSMSDSRPAMQAGRIDFIQVAHTAQRHRGDQLVLQQTQHMGPPLAPALARLQHRAAEQDRVGTQRERLTIGAAPYAAVDQQRVTSRHGRRNPGNSVAVAGIVERCGRRDSRRSARDAQLARPAASAGCVTP